MVNLHSPFDWLMHVQQSALMISGPLQVMGGISNMALWLRMPLTLRAPTSGQRASAASLAEGVSTSDASQQLVANGHHPPQTSAKQTTAGLRNLGRIVCYITMPTCSVTQLAGISQC